MMALINALYINFWNLISLVGLIITVLGFYYTIINVKRARDAAKQAEHAANLAREDIIKSNTVAEFSTAISAMDEIRRLHRQEAWQILPERYSALKKSLIAIRATNPSMLPKHKKKIQDAIVNFSSMEEQIEHYIIRVDSSKIDIPKFNTLISKQVDGLQEILEEIKNQITR